MKKTLIALAALGAAVSVHATNVTVYGVADVGYVDKTGEDISMDSRSSSRLGVKGSEDLGNGLKAIFKLEERFEMTDGSDGKGGLGDDFEGAAWVGLQGDFGKVTLGHMNRISTDLIKKLDPFGQDGVGAMFKQKLRTSGRLDRSARYDSPSMSGVKLALSYTLAETNTDDAGYAIGASYKNDGLYAMVNFNEFAAEKGDNWSIGASYDFGAPKVSIAFESTDNNTLTEDKWLVGLSYALDSGTIMASYNTADNYQGTAGDADQWALGYTHKLSKRTSVYADIANKDVDGADDVTGINIGMKHKF